MRLHRLAMMVLGVLLLFSSAALAQTATGSLSGVVRDESGAVVPGVNVPGAMIRFDDFVFDVSVIDPDP